MFDSLRDDEGVALDEMDGRFDAVDVTDRDVEGSVEDEEELVGVVVAVPHVITQGVRNPYVVVVHAGDDPRAVHLVEARQSGGQVDDIWQFHALQSGRIGQAVCGQALGPLSMLHSGGG